MGPSTKHYEAFKAHFGKTLRMLSEQAGSVNTVCKRLGINRQQFAKYLSGQNVPSAYILQRLVDHFDVDPSVFFVYEETGAPNDGGQVNRFISDIQNGYYIEYAFYPETDTPGLLASAWRIYARSNVTRCHGEQPNLDAFRRGNREFVRLRGTVSSMGQQCLMRASSEGVPADRGLQLAFFLMRYELGPSDWLAMRVESASTAPVQAKGRASLFRFAGTSPDIIDLLTNQCGYFPSEEFDARLKGIAQIVSQHAHVQKGSFSVGT